MKYEEGPMCERTITITEKINTVSEALTELNNLAETLENKLIGSVPKDDCNKPPKPYGGIEEVVDLIGVKISDLFTVLNNLNQRL